MNFRNNICVGRNTGRSACGGPLMLAAVMSGLVCPALAQNNAAHEPAGTATLQSHLAIDPKAERARAALSSAFIFEPPDTTEKLNKQIDALSLAELRLLARDLVGGVPFDLWLDGCERAIRSQTPVATLEAYLVQNNVSPLTAEIVRNNCNIYLHGATRKPDGD